MTQTEPTPIPKNELLERALKVFTVEQLEMLLNDLEAVRHHGYGGVMIVFDNHHLQKFEPTLSKLFPKPKISRVE